MSHVALLGDSIFDNAAYVAAEAAIAVLSLTGGSEYLEFAIAIVLFVALLVGSCLFVLTARAARWAARAVRGVVRLYRAGILVGAPAFLRRNGRGRSGTAV